MFGVGHRTVLFFNLYIYLLIICGGRTCAIHSPSVETRCSPFTEWVLGIELVSSGLEARDFYHQSHLAIFEKSFCKHESLFCFPYCIYSPPQTSSFPTPSLFGGGRRQWEAKGRAPPDQHSLQGRPLGTLALRPPFCQPQGVPGPLTSTRCVGNFPFSEGILASCSQTLPTLPAS